MTRRILSLLVIVTACRGLEIGDIVGVYHVEPTLTYYAMSQTSKTKPTEDRSPAGKASVKNAMTAGVIAIIAEYTQLLIEPTQMVTISNNPSGEGPPTRVVATIVSVRKESETTLLLTLTVNGQESRAKLVRSAGGHFTHHSLSKDGTVADVKVYSPGPKASPNESARFGTLVKSLLPK